MKIETNPTQALSVRITAKNSEIEKYWDMYRLIKTIRTVCNHACAHILIQDAHGGSALWFDVELCYWSNRGLTGQLRKMILTDQCKGGRIIITKGR
jgi:hypothetical protein